LIPRLPHTSLVGLGVEPPPVMEGVDENVACVNRASMEVRRRSKGVA
jgi:hypothetical protein